jgi:hypothetical protein
MLSLPNDGRYPTLELAPQQRRQKTLQALTAQLEALSHSKPLLMIFEDVHWVDPTSLEVLGRTVDRLRTLGVLLIITYRPEFEPPWMGRSYVTTLNLNRLGEREVAALVERVTGNRPLPETIRQDIIERTDGIPLFVEEMTRAVLEAESEGDARRTAAAVPSATPAVSASLHAKKHDYPFELSTEASVNLADDDQLLHMMRDANFFALFIGIESPDEETLVAMSKKQNTRRDLVESIHKIYRSGMFVTAGFIVGFDSENTEVGGSIARFIELSAIPVAMVGLLYALPNTQLTRRLAKEGRLHANHDVAATTGGDQCSTGLNFDTLRPLRSVLEDYKRVLDLIYQPVAYAVRLRRLASLLDRSGSHRSVPTGDVRGSLGAMELVHRIVSALPETREPFWQVFTTCARENPNATRIIVALMALYLHLGPFSRRVIAEIDRRIAAAANS